MSENDETDSTDVDSPELYITALRPSGIEGEILVDYQLTDEFKIWYKKKHGLKRWSQRRFDKELSELVKNRVTRRLTNHSSSPDNHLDHELHIPTSAEIRQNQFNKEEE